MKSRSVQEKGFTVIEIALVISLVTLILILGLPSIVGLLSSQKIDSVSSDIVSLLSEAQNKAMNSDTAGTPAASEFGVHFTSGSYTLFPGTVFNPADTNNFSVSLPSGFSLASNLPCTAAPNDCNNIVFNKLNGEVVNFSSSQNSVCLSDNVGSRYLLNTNFLGVVDVQPSGC